MINNDFQKKRIGSRIKQVRNEMGLTLKEFGNKFVPPASDSIVSRWERGVSIPSDDRLNKIAEMSDMSVFYITSGKKVLSDLSEEEQEQLMEDAQRNSTSSFENMQIELYRDIESLLNTTLNYRQTLFLRNVLDYLHVSNKDDITFMAAFISYTNRYYDAGNSEEVSQDDMNNILDDLLQEVHSFLKRRLSYKEDE